MQGKLFQDIVAESIKIITNPNEHWKSVKEGKDSYSSVFDKFLIPSMLLIFLAVFVGDIIFKSEFGILFKYSIIKATRIVLTILLTYFASILIIYKTSRIFRIPVKFESAKKISIYSMLPLIVITFITGLFPFFSIIGAVAFYCLYLVYSAFINIYSLELQRNFFFLAILILTLLFAYILISLLLTKLTALIIY